MVATVLAVGVVAVGISAGVGQEDGADRGRVAPPAASRAAGEPATRVFSANAWWNTPLSSGVPRYPYASEVLDYLRTAPESGRGCLILAGAGNSPWGQPIYTSRRSDPEYHVNVQTAHFPELATLRIPVGAQPASNSDGSMTVFDPRRDYVVMLTDAKYDEGAGTWSAGGASITYLDSNGLHVATGRSDDPRNRGSHRGNNGVTAAVSWDAVRRGEIRHVLKVAAGPELSDHYVFPMVGSDGDYTGSDPAVPPSGLRMRIKPSIDLEQLGLEGQALVIARALQRYGFYFGDSGGTTALKLEDTVAEGRGQLWDLRADSLCGLPFTPAYWDVVQPGYDPAAGQRAR